jgi:hypothetical protein
MKDSDMNTGSRTRALPIGCALFLSGGAKVGRPAALALEGESK